MADSETDRKASELLNTQEKSIDALHQNLATLHPGSAHLLGEAVVHYKKAHEKFENDVLGIIGNTT